MLSKYVILLIGGIAGWILNGLLLFADPVWTDVVCAVLAGGWIAWYFWHRQTTHKTNNHLFLVLSFILAYIFVLKLPYDFGMHDLGGYALESDGHLGYITLMTHYGRLPTSNPILDGQPIRVHPPLFHIIQAILFKINTFFGCKWWQAFELGQIFSMVCAVACTLIAYDLLQTLHISEKGKHLGIIYILFQPILLILGSVLNNDILSIMCLFSCLLFTIRWNQSRKLCDILAIALSLGSGMAAKLSSALIIPCIAAVFVIVFFQDLHHCKKYIIQFGLFLLISVPIAVAWPFYQLIAHDIPLNYVRIPADELSVASKSLWQRFGIPNFELFKRLFYENNPQTDYNVWLSLLKTGSFDEFELFFGGTTMWYISYLMMAVWAIMIFTSLILFIRWVIQNRKNYVEVAFLSSYGILLFAYFMKFYMDYPYVCTANMRYIAPVLMLGSIGVGYAADHLPKTRWLHWMIYLWATLVCMVYGAYFFTNGVF